MSQLQFQTALTALWIAIAWVPYILDRLAVRGFMEALDKYDPHAMPQSDWAQRAQQAHIPACWR